MCHFEPFPEHSVASGRRCISPIPYINLEGLVEWIHEVYSSYQISSSLNQSPPFSHQLPVCCLLVYQFFYVGCPRWALRVKSICI